MNMKKTIVLAAVLLVAFLYLRKVEIPSYEGASDKSVVFAGLQMSELESMRIERNRQPGAAREVIDLRSLGEKPAPVSGQEGEQEVPSGTEGVERLSWELVEVPGSVLDKSSVDTMVSSIKRLDVGGAIKDSELDKDFSVYGLDNPSLIVSVQRKGKEPVEVAFGKRNEYLLKRYAKVSGMSGVFLVDDGIFAALDKGSADVRSKTPVQFGDEDVRTVRLTSPAGSVKVNQASAGAWKLVEPSELPASSVLVADLLRSVRDLRAVEFIDDPAPELDKYGLNNPAVQFSIDFKEGHVPQKIQVSLAEVKPEGGDSQASKSVYFQLSTVKTIFRSSLDSLDKFTKGEGDLREKRMLTLSADDIETVRASGKGVPDIEIVATNTDWNVNGKRSDPPFVEQLLNDICMVQAVEFPSQVAQDAFKETFLNLEITKKTEPRETIKLVIGKEAVSKSGPARWARVGESGVPVLISDLDAKRIVPHEEALVERAPQVQPTPGATAVP